MFFATVRTILESLRKAVRVLWLESLILKLDSLVLRGELGNGSL